MQGNIHAIVLLSAIPFTFYLGWHYGSFGWKKTRVLWSVLFGVFIWIFAVSFFLCACGPGNNPSTQAWLPALLGMAGGYLIDNKKVGIFFRASIVMLAFGLSWHFHSLVLPSDHAICAYTGETDVRFVKNTCEREVIPVRLWHTSITGLYALRSE